MICAETIFKTLILNTQHRHQPRCYAINYQYDQTLVRLGSEGVLNGLIVFQALIPELCRVSTVNWVLFDSIPVITSSGHRISGSSICL